MLFRSPPLRVAPRTDPYVKNYFIRLFARVWYACPGRGRADRGPTAKRPVDSGTVSGTWLACRPVPSRDLLPSTDSAVAGWPTLFARFVGTTRSSDSSKTFTPDVRLCAFSGRPSSVTREGVFEVSRFSRMEFPRMLRVSDSAASPDDSRLTPSFMLPSPSPYKVGTPIKVISELNGWPARAPVNASPASSRPPTHDSGSG